jgi:hypothetical protein
MLGFQHLCGIAMFQSEDGGLHCANRTMAATIEKMMLLITQNQRKYIPFFLNDPTIEFSRATTASLGTTTAMMPNGSAVKFHLAAKTKLFVLRQ